MKSETGERWRKLCEQAEVEQDPERVLLLVHEVNELLDELLEAKREAVGNGKK